MTRAAISYRRTPERLDGRLALRAPEVWVETVRAEHHDREEGEREPRLPRLYLARTDPLQHDEHPHVGEYRPARREREHGESFHLLDVRRRDGIHANGRDDE